MRDFSKYKEPPKPHKSANVVNNRRRSSAQSAGKPYTGDWVHLRGSEKEYSDEPLTPFPSDTECLCLVELEDGTKEPDYGCVECKGTGKRRFYSLYEQTLKSVGRRNMYEGRDCEGFNDEFISDSPDSLEWSMIKKGLFS